MDDDNYPNFGSAFPNAAPPKQEDGSNEAPRPETEAASQQSEAQRQPADDDDDFFDRYPDATPKRNNAEPPQQQSHDEESAPESPTRQRSTGGEATESLQRSLGLSSEPAVERESQVDVEAPVQQKQDEDEDFEAALKQPEDAAPQPQPQPEEPVILNPSETAQEQAQDLENSMPDEPSQQPQPESPEVLEQVAETGALPSETREPHPEAHYEHQGEALEMETAQDESENAPLMDDEEPAPTPGLASRPPTFVEVEMDEGLDGSDDVGERPAPQPLVAVGHKPIDRSFTTNFTEAPKAEDAEEGEEEEHRAVVDENWPAAGDDKTFGELLDDEPRQESAREEAALVPAEIQKNEWPAAEEDNAFGELLGGTTQGDDPPQQESTREEAAAPEPPAQPAQDVWPAMEEDNTFGELLGDKPQEEKSFEAIIGKDTTAETAPSAKPAEEDLSAAWAAALDDDDILDDKEIDPKDFFGDDDEGLLEDDEPFLEDTQPQPSAPGQGSAARSAYTPTAAQQPQPRAAPYAAPSTPFLDQNAARSAGTPDTGLFDVYNQPGATQQSQGQPLQRPGLSSSQSFADKAKGGYQSPYDLPMEVVKPRRRPQQAPPPQHPPMPPPRSSSFQGAPPSQAPSAPPHANMTPPTSSHSNQAMLPSALNGATPPVASKSTPKSDSGFFADLPMATKPRVRPSGAYTPQPGGMPTPPVPQQPPMPPRAASYAQALPVQTPPVHAPPRPAIPQAPAQQPPMAGGLRQPEKNPLFPEQPAQAPAVQEIPPSPAPADRYNSSAQPAAAPTTSRYSPAPAPTSTAPPATSRYSPAPVQQPQQTPKTAQRYASAPGAGAAPPIGRSVSQFAPRTSSPLAMHGRPSQTQQDMQELARNAFSPVSPPPANGLQGAMGLSPQRRDSSDAKYTPPSTSGSMTDSNTSGPPQRPRTQSPGAVMKQPKTSYAPVDRRGSAGQVPPIPTVSEIGAQPMPTKLPHRRQFSRDLTFAAPQDERAQDVLQRWRGHPVFKWSASGTVVSCFPKQTPFYAAGQAAPSIKCTPGPVVVQDATALMPLEERDAKFPGPLAARSKGKKKEVLAWMAGKIEDLERETEGAMLDFNLRPDDKKRVEEKLVLWKLVMVYLEHDGVLEGNPKIEEEVRRILLPNLAQMNQVAELQSPVSAIAQPDAVDPQVLAQLRQALFEGQRERAVWLAEEKKLWGHAMLLASTMGPDVWKQIVASFVRSQVRSVGSDARSLAALYQVFAGNAEDCVDELVPPSARAGFQMISKTDGARAGNPLEGMDQWRETLALITGNRTPSDPASIIALGKLLASYGRVEAAHSCYLFARALAKHSGADDADAHFVLLGADHTMGDANLDSIMLTEVYEYATSLSAPSTAVHYLPHLQSYKLAHGQNLAAHALKAKAEAYCAHVDAAIRSTTRPSGYYHQSLASELIAFNAFLSQTPHTGEKGKFFSKPAMDKVSSGVGSWFTKFVSGEEAENDSGAPTPGQVPGSGESVGPFGGVNGEHGSISRSASGTELYNPMHAPALSAPFQPTPAPAPAAVGRYATGAAAANRYAPAVPSQFAPSRSSMDSDRSYEPQTPQNQHANPYAPAADQIRPASARYASYAPSQAQSPNMLGVPRPSAERASSDWAVPYDGTARRGSGVSAVSAGSYEPKPVLAEGGGFGDHVAREDPEGGDVPHGYNPEGGTSYALPAPVEGGYEPPAQSGGYEPPSSTYTPYEPERDLEEESPRQLKPKKSMVDLSDDDDDIAARAAALKKSQHSDADAAADAAFRAAAEADAARDNKKSDAGGAEGKKGWLSGWFGGKKDASANNGPGPIRAKLGEENSFYFDKQLGKWVNKKGGQDSGAASAAPTPPPPKGPPSRVASGAMGPPSRVGSGTSLAGMAGPPPGAGSRPPTSSGPPVPGSSPPSRAGTPGSVSGGVGGPGQGGVASAVQGAPGVMAPPARPSSSMSTASSLDDLMAAGPARGGKASVKGKKKGGRYVDVMAK